MRQGRRWGVDFCFDGEEGGGSLSILVVGFVLWRREGRGGWVVRDATLVFCGAWKDASEVRFREFVMVLALLHEAFARKYDTLYILLLRSIDWLTG